MTQCVTGCRNNSVVCKSADNLLDERRSVKKSVAEDNGTASSDSQGPNVSASMQSRKSVDRHHPHDKNRSKTETAADTSKVADARDNNAGVASNKFVGDKTEPAVKPTGDRAAKNALKNPLLADVIQRGKPSSPCQSDDESLLTQISKITKWVARNCSMSFVVVEKRYFMLDKLS